MPANASAAPDQARPKSRSEGPVIFSAGFRILFFGGAVWAVCAMGIWLPLLFGVIELPVAWDPVSWHSHAFLFGYLSAILGGFLLTAVPNWTRRMPLKGAPLAGLFALWLLGRLAILTAGWWPALLVAIADLSFLVVLWGFVLREIVTGKNWRNLIVAAMVAVFICGNALFHWDAAHGAYAAQGLGFRVGLGAAVMMIAVIGGRIVPSFTANFLRPLGPGKLPASPMGTFDKVALLILLVALIHWSLRPEGVATGGLLILAGLLHSARLARWAGLRTLRTPIIFVLHVAYAFVPLGALALGGAMVFDIALLPAAQHLWMAGAIGMMTLAVMTRATLGHSGRALVVGVGTGLVYLAFFVSVFARFAGGVWPSFGDVYYGISAVFWIASFLGFLALYGPLMIRPRLTAQA